MSIKHSILFLLPRFSGGGAERVVLNLLIELNNLGYSIGIIVFDLSGPLKSMVPDNVPIYNLGTSSLKYSIIPLVKKIRQLRPKVVFSTFGYINVAVLSIHWLFPQGVKIWIREANLPSISIPNNRYPKIINILYWVLYRKTDKLICTSRRMKNEFIFDFLIPEPLIKILPNPVDVSAIRTLSIPKKKFNRGGVCYIASGRLTFQKGFDRLLKWFSKLDNKSSTLIILGEGNLKDELIKESELLGIQDRVKIKGFCDNPWQWYMGADVFLLPSRWEGMPNVVLEALACGTPVIATEESGGIKEIAKECKENSILITGNKKQFIDAMNKTEIKKNTPNSLLPEIYNKKNSISIIENWLNNCNTP